MSTTPLIHPTYSPGAYSTFSCADTTSTDSLTRKFSSLHLEHFLSKSECQLLSTLHERAWWLDRGFRWCGVAVGLDGFIGLLPVVGDVIGCVMSLLLVWTACQFKLPASVLCLMILNVLFDLIIGLLPVIGDILDVLYPCNLRNVQLLEKHLLCLHTLRHSEQGIIENERSRETITEPISFPVILPKASPPPSLPSTLSLPSTPSIPNTPLMSTLSIVMEEETPDSASYPITVCVDNTDKLEENFLPLESVLRKTTRKASRTTIREFGTFVSWSYTEKECFLCNCHHGDISTFVSAVTTESIKVKI
ncbi:hypothetical protein BDF14DRAFT_1777703 [Spinellus fusiger]|nr:hypothetical protein BDF14DRAFT_1777703 [Spinellus fusiger]